MSDKPGKFDPNSAKRIIKTVQWVEQQPYNTPGQRQGGPPERPPIWARITGIFKRRPQIVSTDPDEILPVDGMTITGDPIFYSWAAVTTDGEVARYGYTPNADPPMQGHASAFQVNATPNTYVPPGVIVELHFAGNDNQGQPLYRFSWTGAEQNAGLIPHDHRSNDPNYGGLSFSCYSPGTALPQMPWAI
ncbi:MAG: hypothetical protein FWD61_03320 [Phycisphaerales bacterium]|nr:hypothetical protein [Phycisphaerales bacterium]